MMLNNNSRQLEQHPRYLQTRWRIFMLGLFFITIFACLQIFTSFKPISMSYAATKKGAVTVGFVAGEKVLIEWKGKWWRGKVHKKSRGKYYISYDGWSKKWNEWVPLSRLRGRCAMR